jgi:hypothetical protein
VLCWAEREGAAPVVGSGSGVLRSCSGRPARWRRGAGKSAASSSACGEGCSVCQARRARDWPGGCCGSSSASPWAMGTSCMLASVASTPLEIHAAASSTTPQTRLPSPTSRTRARPADSRSPPRVTRTAYYVMSLLSSNVVNYLGTFSPHTIHRAP